MRKRVSKVAGFDVAKDPRVGRLDNTGVCLVRRDRKLARPDSRWKGFYVFPRHFGELMEVLRKNAANRVRLLLVDCAAQAPLGGHGQLGKSK